MLPVQLASVKGQDKKQTKKTLKNNYCAQQVTLKTFYFFGDTGYLAECTRKKQQKLLS